MDKSDVIKILNKIKAFRQSFLIEKDKPDAWLKVLQSYSYEDVNNKLDDFFKDNNNFGLYPDPYYLTRGLVKIIDKSKSRNITITCQICGDKVLMSDHPKHFDRCSSVEYIYNMAKKHFNRKVKKQNLKNFNDDKFNKLYWSFCDELYKVMCDGLERHLLKNSILSHKGLNVEYDLDEIIEEKLKGE